MGLFSNDVEIRDDSGNAIPISAASLPLPALAATSTKQSDGTQKTQVVDGSGNVIGATTNALDVNIKSGALATNQSVNVAQINGVTPLMGNGITGTGSQRVTIASDNTAFAVNATLQASSAVIGHVITDATSVTAATLSAETTKVIGVVRTADGSGNLLTSTTNALDVNLKTSSITLAVSGTVTTTPPSNASTNVAQFGGVNVSTGVGASGTGIPRVTVANDSNILATQSGTWNIGTLTTLTGITNALPAGSNVIGHVISDTGSTTAVTGTVTVAGAKTNNNAAPGATNVGTLPGVATNATPTYTEGNQVALSTDLTGALRISGGAGGTQYAELSTTTPATGNATLGRYNSTAPILTSGQMQMLQLDSSGNLKVAGLTSSSASSITQMNNQQVGGNDITTTADGVQLVSVAGPTGDPVDTVGNALSVAATQNGNWNVSNNVEVGTLFNYVESTASILVKGTSGYLLSIIITNYNASKRYFQLFDQKTAPIAGNTAILSIPIPGGTANTPGYLELGPAFFGSGGLATLLGIAVGVSAINTTFGAATSTDHTIAGLFV